jgi:uncharacterized protein (UPF0276 family)
VTPAAPLTLESQPERNVSTLRGSEGLRAGIGLRATHHHELATRGDVDVGWLEAHSENYFARGGLLPGVLGKVRERYPLSLHGVGLSIGSTDPLDRTHLGEIARLVHDFEPMLVSEHLSWGSVGGRSTNDLLPMPYTEEALRHMSDRVRQVQDFLGRQILIENVSSYLRFTCSDITEWDFLGALTHESGCGLLLDVNNVYVNAMNHGFDAYTFLSAIPRQAVQEMHLAGHSIRVIEGREVRIDTHDAPVCDEVWALYAAAVERFGPVPTLIEWDSNIPALDVLAAEARKADRMTEAHRARAA